MLYLTSLSALRRNYNGGEFIRLIIDYTKFVWERSYPTAQQFSAKFCTIICGLTEWNLITRHSLAAFAHPMIGSFAHPMIGTSGFSC
jgi:hypothetical protein